MELLAFWLIHSSWGGGETAGLSKAADDVCNQKTAGYPPKKRMKTAGPLRAAAET